MDSGKPGAPGGKKDLTPLTAYGIYGAAGLQLGVSVVGFLLIGNYLDGKYDTAPWLAVIGLVFGFVGGLANLIRIVRRFAPDGDKGNKR